jgi:hypothetical protein
MGGIMGYIVYAIAMVGVLIAISTAFEYWQCRNLLGLSHTASLNESSVAGTFLSGSAVFGFIVAVLV